MAEQTNGRMASYLAEHPRMAGALFTMMVLVTKAGTVAASHAGSCDGP